MVAIVLLMAAPVTVMTWMGVVVEWKKYDTIMIGSITMMCQSDAESLIRMISREEWQQDMTKIING